MARDDSWRTTDVDALVDALLALEGRDEAMAFLRDLCTLGEIRDMAQRWAVARLLDEAQPRRGWLSSGPCEAAR
jgi:TrpR-related protein YerC/YecD